jgi:5'(3')-deoxyribonucleotidase
MRSRSTPSYSKGVLCQELQVGFFVDDKVENVEDISSKGIYTLLFHASHNREYKTSLPLVKNWLEVQRHITSFLGNTPF